MTIVGSNFVSSASLACRFGTAGTVAASFASATQVVCLSPRADTAALVALAVSNNNADFVGSASFTYDGA